MQEIKQKRQTEDHRMQDYVRTQEAMLEQN